MNSVYIGGEKVNDDTSDLDEFTIDIGYDTETRSYTNTISKTITVIGDTFKNVKDYFLKCGSIEPLNALYTTDSCGGVQVPLVLKEEGVRIYPDAQQAEVTLQSLTEENVIFNKLSTTLWYENDFVQNKEIPVVFYGDQPNWIQWAVYLLTFTIRIILNLIDNVLNTICEIVTLSFGNCKINLSGAVFRRLDNWLTGLGRWATAPLFRDIFEYQCSQCGAGFSSSILQNTELPYHNLAMFHLDAGEYGSHENLTKKEKQRILLKNAPLLTVIDLLDMLKPVFNADYRIVNNTLYFEEVSFFEDLADVEIANLHEHCDYDYYYETEIDKNYAYGYFEFSRDAYDREGNQMLPYYKLVIPYTDDYNGKERGKRDYHSIRFSVPRFMFDQKSREVSGFFDWQYQIDRFRTGANSVFEDHLFQNDGIKRTRDLLISGNMLSVPKLLILEPNFNYDDAHTIRRALDSEFYEYNYPLYYKDELEKTSENGTESVPAIHGALATYAQTFKEQSGKKHIIPSITIECDCEVVKSALENFESIYLTTHLGKGIAERGEATISDKGIKITFENVRIKC